MTESPAGNQEPTAESEVIRKFAETYAQRTGTYFCSDPGVTSVVLKGLARHKDELGGALCPCRHYEDKRLKFHSLLELPLRADARRRNAIACSSD